MTWCAKKVKFLGFHLEEGKIKIRDYLEGKWKALTQVNNIQQLERAIGILSYCRRSILGVGRIIEPLNKKLIEIKKFGMDEEGWRDVSELVEEAFRQAMDRVTDRYLLGKDIVEFILSTDWAQGYGGYTLEVQRSSGELQLVDLGSKRIPSPLSSYLGELEALKWALKATSNIRGDRSTLVRSDNKGVVQS